MNVKIKMKWKILSEKMCIIFQDFQTWTMAGENSEMKYLSLWSVLELMIHKCAYNMYNVKCMYSYSWRKYEITKSHSQAYFCISWDEISICIYLQFHFAMNGLNRCSSKNLTFSIFYLLYFIHNICCGIQTLTRELFANFSRRAMVKMANGFHLFICDLFRLCWNTTSFIQKK